MTEANPFRGVFAGRTVLVTGGSGGIGREICRRFAASGAQVFVHYASRPENAEQTLTEVAEVSLANGFHQVHHRAVHADLTQPEQVAQMVDDLLEVTDGIDILINNAGLYERHRLDTVDFAVWQDVWRRTLDLNLIGAANAIFCVARKMIAAGSGGRIVNISSRGAFRGEPESPAYGASKAGLNALSQSLAQHLAPYGIFVYAIAPGFVETAMARPYLTGDMAAAIMSQSPLGRVAAVGDVAYWALAMSAPGAEFATGSVVDVNGASYLRT